MKRKEQSASGDNAAASVDPSSDLQGECLSIFNVCNLF